jgi:hypothetical protein
MASLPFGNAHTAVDAAPMSLEPGALPWGITPAVSRARLADRLMAEVPS